MCWHEFLNGSTVLLLDFPGGSDGKSICLQWKIPWRREKLPTLVFWPGEFHGLYCPWGRKELDITERLSLHFTSLYKCYGENIKKNKWLESDRVVSMNIWWGIREYLSEEVTWRIMEANHPANWRRVSKTKRISHPKLWGGTSAVCSRTRKWAWQAKSEWGRNTE